MSEGDADIHADEVIAALEDYQGLTLDILRTHQEDPEGCVRELVRLHLTWTEENADTARLVAKHRNAVANGPGKDRLAASNATFFNANREWMQHQTEAGRMPPMSFNVMHAIVFAPTQELAKLYLGGRLRKNPTEYAEVMGDAAWAGLQAVGKSLG